MYINNKMGKHSVRKSHRKAHRKASRKVTRFFKKSRKSRRQSRKSFFKRMFSRSKKGSKKGSKRHRKSFWKRFLSRRKSRFGHGVSANMPNTAKMMGNITPPYMMNTWGQYTGMGPEQTMNHLNGIPLSLRTNFYSDIN